MLSGIIGGAAGALGGIFGGIGKNRMLRKQQEMIDQQKAENQNWYDRRYNEDATQRADAQRILTMTAEAIRNRNRSAAGSAAVMGGTDESVAAEKAANAKAMADAASQIAVNGDARKDQIESQYMSRKQALNEQLRELEGQKQSGWDIASNAVGGAFDGFAKGMGLGEKPKS